MKRGEGEKRGISVLGVIYVLYLLLCLPVTVRLCIGLNDTQSAVQASAGVLGLQARFDGVIEQKGKLPMVRIAPRYGKARKRKTGRTISMDALRMAKPYALAVVKIIRFSQVDLHMRVGMEDAAGTALTAGAVRALAAAFLSCMQGVPACDLRVEADFRAPCFLMTAHCIFSARPGDIMIAVVKTAVKKTQKEGFKWMVSIPSRA